MVMTATKLLSALHAGTCCQLEALRQQPDVLRRLAEDGKLTVTECGIVLLPQAVAPRAPVATVRRSVGATTQTSTRTPTVAALMGVARADEDNEDDDWVGVDCA